MWPAGHHYDAREIDISKAYIQLPLDKPEKLPVMYGRAARIGTAPSFSVRMLRIHPQAPGPVGLLRPGPALGQRLGRNAYFLISDFIAILATSKLLV